MKRVADYLIERIIQFGIKDAFVVTGGGAMHLNDAISRNKKIDTTYFHHEQSAAMAADGYNRYKNKIALVNVTTGPGGVNALNGVFGAYTDSLNIIILSGQVKKETYSETYSDDLRQLGDQEVNIKSMVHKITKYSTTLKKKENCRYELEKCFYFLTHGRPGPVWIDIPIDIQGALIEPSKLKSFNFKNYLFKDDYDVPPNTILELSSKYSNPKQYCSKVTNLLKSASAPVLMVGTGVRISGTHNMLLNLVNKIKIPVVTAWNAHDQISNSNKYYCGRPGTIGDRAGNFTVQNADLIIILGCRLNIRQISYNWPSFAKKAIKVMVDIDPSELSKPTLNIDLKIRTDLKIFLPKFVEYINETNYKSPVSHRKYLIWCKDKLIRYPTVLPQYHKSKKLNPYVFLEKLFEIINNNDLVVTANGSACVMTFQTVKIKKHRLFTNSGSASMGYELPASIGACIAMKKNKVICIAGDGSIMMNLQELQTISGNKLPIKIFIINNRGYASILQTQKNYFADNLSGTDPSNGVYFPNFEKIAKGFDLDYQKITSVEMMSKQSLIKKINNHKPYIFEVVVDENQDFAPKLTSRKLDDGTMISPELEDMSPFLTQEEMIYNIYEP